jgi:adenosyl cobinamide kinase/adenosyl cobinamide phosphate guanylyltransferase
VIILLLGGARSGKSLVAERLAATLPEPVSYVATSPPESVSADPDMAARVAAHRARRPASWRTIEPGEQLCTAVADLPGTLLIDGLGAWVAARPDFDVDTSGLCRAVTTRGGDTVIVSDEVGLGVHPASDAGRRFRDALGEVNQAVAAIADDVLLVVAGRTLRLERAGPGTQPRESPGRDGRRRAIPGVPNPPTDRPGGAVPGLASPGLASPGLASPGPEEPTLEEWRGRL